MKLRNTTPEFILPIRNEQMPTALRFKTQGGQSETKSSSRRGAPFRLRRGVGSQPSAALLTRPGGAPAVVYRRRSRMTLRNPHADPRQRTDPPTFKQTEEPWKGNPEKEQRPLIKRDLDRGAALRFAIALILVVIVVMVIAGLSIVSIGRLSGSTVTSGIRNELSAIGQIHPGPPTTNR